MTNQIRLGAIFWVLTAEFFLAQFLAQAAWPGYSMTVEDISLLGVTSCGAYLNPAPGGIMPVCSPLSLVFNIGMALNGLLVVLGVWFTRDLWPQTRLKLVALWLLALGGDGTMLAGIFPLDTNPGLHLIGAVLALGLSCFGFIALARVVWYSHRGFALYSLATGVLALAGFVLYAAEIYLGGRGTVERLAAWPQTLWYMVTGALILRGHFAALVKSDTATATSAAR
ncbi:DUF998 domain-containing protein [Devosia beringensis]|uniref:DUF998 domain-containing protein n=1 Tax=Devosia beringensis TaxID=2657486 RepID=UPI00186B99D9|nr:DUF998 domain-containing protein [Devosia beringensis]